MSGKHHKSPWWRLGVLWRRLCGRGHPVTPPPHLIPIVDGSTSWEHLATEAAFEQGLQERAGRYTVLCGLQINVASMVTPPDWPCQPCHELRGRA
ncbi:MAG: hypothetical protein JO115_13570 [Pseudonocardiales bacterium]|nr:hypothetical protein [Pseudonocardiales bacterium]